VTEVTSTPGFEHDLLGFPAIRRASCLVSSLAAGSPCSALARDQLASRQVVAGSSRSSAPSCNRTGSLREWKLANNL
jgi:hypothetical protein